LFGMKGRGSEHTFYFVPPKVAAQADEGVGKACREVEGIPWLNDEVAGVRCLEQVPQPDHRVQPQTQARRSVTDGQQNRLMRHPVPENLPCVNTSFAFGPYRQIVEFGIALHARNNRSGQPLARKRRVKPVCHHTKRPLPKPSPRFVDHLWSQLDKAGPVCAVQSHVDGQDQGDAGPIDLLAPVVKQGVVQSRVMSPLRHKA